jgi:hypothetical protein
MKHQAAQRTPDLAIEFRQAVEYGMGEEVADTLVVGVENFFATAGAEAAGTRLTAACAQRRSRLW